MNTIKRGLRFNFWILIGVLCLGSACATYQVQTDGTESMQSLQSNKTVTQTVYLVGGYGNTKDKASQANITTKLKESLSAADNNSLLLFLGDNISPKKNQEEHDNKLLDEQLGLAKEFEGYTYFMSGVNEWKYLDVEKLEEYEDYVDDKGLKNLEFEEKNGCPLEYRVIDEQLDLIIVNSYWFVSNWDRIHNINQKCTNITTKKRFIEELEGYINDAQGKNLIIAMHHPVFSNGTYAGSNTLKNHLLPVPILGTAITEAYDLANLSRNQLDFPRYRYLRILVSALAQKSKRVTVVSAHEASLQYLKSKGLNQVISGSIAATAPADLANGFINAPGGSLDYTGKFAYGQQGFAILRYYTDGSSAVEFVTTDENSYYFNDQEAFVEKPSGDFIQKDYPKTVEAAIVKEQSALNKSGFYKFIWGDRYRSLFGKKVTAPVAILDTLYGGLRIIQEGGGHQSNSLRLVDKNNKQYAMRSLKKEALKFLTFKVKGVAYDTSDYEDTVTEELVSDFFTTAHPYMQMVIDGLAAQVDVNHSNTQLYYIPKQKALGVYNEAYGDALYFIEQRPSEEQKKYSGYRRADPEKEGEIPDFESTTDMLEKIKEDESYKVDQKTYIRSRVFDMLIGDWDRHQDQWRWVEYEVEDEDETIFIPVPRDRDNTFSKFDGIAFPLIKMFSPMTRGWQSYDDTIKNLKWFNREGYDLDITIANKFGVQTWIEEAKFIQQHLEADAIENAFSSLPNEIKNDSITNEIKNNLKKRLEDLDEYAKKYATYLNNQVVVYGTHKDDIFEIERLPNQETRIVVRRNLSDEKNEIFYERIIDGKVTKQVLVYGLNDDDIFSVKGEVKGHSRLKIIGGYGDDVYQIQNKRKVTVFDWKFEKSSFEEKKPSARLTNLYESNTLHWRYFQKDYNTLMPTLGTRNDDGVFAGLSNTFVKKGLHSDGGDFIQKHQLTGNYYFQFQTVEFLYEGIFANIFPNWNLTLEGRVTSDGFTDNFFGLGNESENDDEQLGEDFNRAQMQQTAVSAKISYRSLFLKGLYESFDVQQNNERFFTTTNVDALVFDRNAYVGLETGISFDTQNALDFPTKSLSFELQGGFKQNIDNSENNFGYLSFALGAGHKIIPSGDLVLSSTAEIKTNIGDNYFFYHAPTIGGNNGLRGYRNDRFSGDTYFYQSSDLKFRIKRFVTSVFPVTLGTYGGFDYGRVWVDGEDSNIWHTSFGGGVWLSGAETFAANIGVFGSNEGVMVQGGIGIGF
ncbi:hypothetical protein [Aquimarina brevivitae]|uniref:Haemolysin activator HlyB C-terminal domain-containing protein n=1 Tax=Aquimarina brevivitae TaxID=323412 RepID=A0A4Q7NTS2_9FLAO|nr:hypothetical protein [Aquimarina brevivitae]RZS90586.1 hypothetical protein EV197_3381 [Aquimarina brevivitae]